MKRDSDLKTFRDATRTKAFTLTAQLQLDAASDKSSILKQAAGLSDAVDGIQVTDSPSGSPHPSPLAAASFLLAAGIDPIVHLTCRDRNRIALKSDLLGAAALGVTSLLLQRGDKLKNKSGTEKKQVFDIRARRLLRMARKISNDHAELKRPELYLGTITTIFDAEADWYPEKLTQRIDAGAQFIQTQMCCNPELLERYMERLTAAQITRRCHVVVTVPVLPSAESALWVRKNIRGPVMPEAMIHRLDSAADPRQEGINLCAELLSEFHRIPGLSGAHLLTPGDPDLIREAIAAANLKG